MFRRSARDDALIDNEGNPVPRHMVLSLTQPDQTTRHEDPTMSKLKAEVAEQLYTVDSALVAEEILRKLRMIKSTRRQLLSEPGRSPQPKLRGL